MDFNHTILIIDFTNYKVSNINYYLGIFLKEIPCKSRFFILFTTKIFGRCRVIWPLIRFNISIPRAWPLIFWSYLSGFWLFYHRLQYNENDNNNIIFCFFYFVARPFNTNRGSPIFFFPFSSRAWQQVPMKLVYAGLFHLVFIQNLWKRSSCVILKIQMDSPLCLESSKKDAHGRFLYLITQK